MSKGTLETQFHLLPMPSIWKIRGVISALIHFSLLCPLYMCKFYRYITAVQQLNQFLLRYLSSHVSQLKGHLWNLRIITLTKIWDIAGKRQISHFFCKCKLISRKWTIGMSMRDDIQEATALLWSVHMTGCLSLLGKCWLVLWYSQESPG